MEDNRQITFRFISEPTDTNFGGKVHGGMVMKWIDQTGFACATAWSQQYCVTAYVGGIKFYRPIHIGYLVEVKAKIVYTGKTSMHIAIDVMATDPKVMKYEKTTHCIIIFVAVNSIGNPVPIPAWNPVSEEDKKFESYAVKLMEMRKGITEEMRNYF